MDWKPQIKAGNIFKPDTDGHDGNGKTNLTLWGWTQNTGKLLWWDGDIWSKKQRKEILED